MDYTRKMLNEIRKRVSELHSNIDLPKSNLLKEDNGESKKKDLDDDEKTFVIKSSDVQFGSVRNAQEDAIRKTVGDVKLKDDALKYYPQINDLVLNGEINGLNLTFQFRYKDPSGDGCYIWGKGLQLTDSNSTTIDKIRDAFLNWKKSITDDGDLMDKLHKEATKE